MSDMSACPAYLPAKREERKLNMAIPQYIHHTIRFPPNAVDIYKTTLNNNKARKVKLESTRGILAGTSVR